MLWLLCNGCVRSAQVVRLWRVVSLREVTATQVAFTHASVRYFGVAGITSSLDDFTRNALILVCALALKFIEDNLSNTHVVRGYLYILVLLNVLQCLFQRENHRWWQYRLVVC